jgi:hypothetical protein
MTVSLRNQNRSPRGERRSSAQRFEHLTPDLLARAAKEGDARLEARIKQLRGE